MTDLPAKRYNETDTDAILRRTAELAPASSRAAGESTSP